MTLMASQMASSDGCYFMGRQIIRDNEASGFHGEDRAFFLWRLSHRQSPVK
jgi:hypothetical protein